MNDYFFDQLKKISDRGPVAPWEGAVFGALRTIKQVIESRDATETWYVTRLHDLERKVASLETTVRCAHVQPTWPHDIEFVNVFTDAYQVKCTCGEFFQKATKSDAHRAWARHSLESRREL